MNLCILSPCMPFYPRRACQALRTSRVRKPWPASPSHTPPTSLQGHGQLDFMRRPLVGTVAHHRIDRHHVVQRSQLETPARQELNAEILGMAIGRAQQQEQHLRRHQRLHVGLGVHRLPQPAKQYLEPWTAIVLVLAQWRAALDLAKVFLWQTHEPLPIGRDAPVETLYHQHALPARTAANAVLAAKKWTGFMAEYLSM